MDVQATTLVPDFVNFDMPREHLDALTKTVSIAIQNCVSKMAKNRLTPHGRAYTTAAADFAALQEIMQALSTAQADCYLPAAEPF